MPVLSRNDIRDQFKKCVEARKPDLFALQLHHHLGLRDKDGRVVKKDGLPTLAEDRKVRAGRDVSLRVLTEALLGEDWATALRLNAPDDGDDWGARILRESKRVSEEALAPVTPGTFINVGPWSLAVSGLFAASFMEGYQTAEFTIRDLFPARPAKAREEKMVGIVGPLEPAREVGPGEAHPDVGMNAMWVQTGPLRTYGAKITIVKETAFAVISGMPGAQDPIQEAQNIGWTIAYRENELSLDVLTGQTNNFAFGTANDQTATAYNTYGSAFVSNDIVNPLLDPVAFQTIDNTIATYRHPLVSTLPINVTFGYASWLSAIQNFSVMNQPGVPVPPAPGTFPSASWQGPNPWVNRYAVVNGGVWLQDRHTRDTASGGLGLTADNARRYYAIQRNRSAVRRIGWEAMLVSVNPNEYVAADQRVVAGQIGNVSTQVQIINPHGFLRNKVA
jgi:hypothetical protein